MRSSSSSNGSPAHPSSPVVAPSTDPSSIAFTIEIQPLVGK